MLKCINANSSEFIVILDPHWRGHLSELRELDIQDRLVCPSCHQPVRTRAGKIKRWHFAHKHLQNCPFQNESLLLLQTRAALYEWLLDHYGADKVTVEKIMPDLPFPRHIDCWVEQEQGPVLYWIFDTRRPPEERKKIQEGFKTPGLHPHSLFTTSMLNPDEHEPLHLYLTTTEREFMQLSPFDELVRGYTFTPGKTLHYLDADANTLISYRNLHLVHPPQEFSGSRLATSLEKVHPVPETGEFVHPGEQDRLVKYQAEAQKRQEKQQRTLPYLLKQSNRPSSEQESTPAMPSPTTHKPSPEAQSSPFSKAGVCKVCSISTYDWITYDGKTGTCLCRNCYNKVNP